MKKAAIYLTVSFVLMLGGALLVLLFLPTVIEEAGATMKFTEKTETISESVSKITADVSWGTVEFLPSEDGTCTVTREEKKDVTFAVSVNDGSLKIVMQDSRPWYNRLFTFRSPTVTVRLPKGTYEALTVRTSSGKITVADGFTFSTATVTATSGDVRYCSDGGNLNLSATSGEVELNGVSAETLQAKVSSGDLVVNSVTAKRLTLSGSSGSIYVNDAALSESLSVKLSSGTVTLAKTVSKGDFSATVTSGGVYLDRCDGKKIDIKTTSGSVRGTLLSEKIFNAKATSGSVRVPDSTPNAQGICNINTTSGSINISLAE
ncbi:MAG: DUF4097 family beta strand repeat protein [Clostridia bacterium]|nr:DUF4097 family beta strand repeat protein [Clostridia bacterium]